MAFVSKSDFLSENFGGEKALTSCPIAKLVLV